MTAMHPMLFVLCLALLAFGTINLVVSAAVILCVRLIRLDGPPRALARRFLLLRALPGTVSLLFVLTIFLPGVCSHEPGGVAEHVSPAMCLLATAAAAILIAAAIRGLQSIWATRRLSRSWAARAQRVNIPELPIPAFVIDTQFPVVAIVGIYRQNLFIARQVLEHCSVEELRAIWAHERAHLRCRDNLQRLLLQCCPDLLMLTPVGASLERGWARASEEAADDEAVKSGSRLDLASALGKVARLARTLQPRWIPAMNLYHGAGVADRLNRLLKAQTLPSTAVVSARRDGLRFLLFVTSLLIAATVELPHLGVATEWVVRFLQ
jgi:Zn-dependent protease with chaperone function